MFVGPVCGLDFCDVGLSGVQRGASIQHGGTDAARNPSAREPEGNWTGMMKLFFLLAHVPLPLLTCCIQPAAKPGDGTGMGEVIYLRHAGAAWPGPRSLGPRRQSAPPQPGPAQHAGSDAQPFAQGLGVGVGDG